MNNLQQFLEEENVRIENEMFGKEFDVFKKTRREILEEHNSRIINKVLDEVMVGLQAQGSLAINGGQFMYSKHNLDILLEKLKVTPDTCSGSGGTKEKYLRP